MKKSVFFLAAGALAFTACTSQEVIDEGVLSSAIGFDNSVMKSSRADQAVSGDLTNGNLDKFLVYGFYTPENQTATPIQVFGGEPVTKDASGKWTYKNIRYWVPNATYNFFAYSCADIGLANDYGTVGLDLNATGSNRQLVISNYRCDQFHNHDLIYAQVKDMKGIERTEANPTPNPNVAFSFNHILTKVDVLFMSEFSNEYDIVVSDVRIVNFRNVGGYTETAKWTNVNRDKSNPTNHSTVQDIYIQLGFDNEDNEGVVRAASPTDASDTGLTPKTGSAYMIPFKYELNDVQLTFNIVLYKGKEHNNNSLVMSRSLVGTWSPNWELGKYYTYTVRLTGTAANLQPIVFETAADMNLAWGTGGSSTATDIRFSTN